MICMKFVMSKISDAVWHMADRKPHHRVYDLATLRFLLCHLPL